MEDYIYLIVLVLLLFLSAFFSSAETAFSMVNVIRIRTSAGENNRRAKKVLSILENKKKMLSAILIGNNVVNLSASAITTILAGSMFKSMGVGVATGILTLLILIFGEISPKTMATIKAEKIAMAYCDIISFLMFVLTPVIFLVDGLSSLVLMLFGIRRDEKAEAMTEEEFRTITDVGEESGAIESEEHEIIHNLLDFGNDEARQIMIQRVDMTVIPKNASYDEMMSIYADTMYTRFPVCDENIDNIIGILNMKDVLLASISGKKDGSDLDIEALMRKPYFTYEHKNISELFRDMKGKGETIAVVLDEYGLTAGIITIEDLMEEIVGEIRDEYDKDEGDMARTLAGGVFIVNGSMDLEDFSKLTGLPYESERSETIGGYLMERLEHIPEEKEKYEDEENNTLIIVKKMDKLRIETLVVRPLAKSV